MASLTPSPKMQFFDANGNPLSGGKLYTYAAGTTTPQATYTDSTGVTTNANPVVMNSRGEASVWLGSSLYYMELKDSSDVLIWTADNIGGVATLSALAASGGASMVGFIQSGSGAVARTAQAKMRETVSVEDFGAVGDGITDDAPAIQLALDSIGATGGMVELRHSGKYLIDSNLTIPANVWIIGGVEWVGTPTNNFSQAWGSLGALIVNSAATITMKSGSGIKGCLIYRKGIVFPVDAAGAAAFAGTAIYIAPTPAGPLYAGYDDVSVLNCYIFGFATAIATNNSQRYRIEHVSIDCTNGLDLQQAGDSSTIRDVNINGITSMPLVAAGGSITLLHRSGIGVKFYGPNNDGVVIEHLATYGYQTGLYMENVINAKIVDGFFDNTLSYTGSIGIDIETGVSGCSFVNCSTWSVESGVKYAGTAGNCNTFTSCFHYQCVNQGINFVSGTMKVVGSHFSPSGVASLGININSAGCVLLADYLWFTGFTALEIFAPANTPSNNIMLGNHIYSDKAAGGTVVSPNVIWGTLTNAATLPVPNSGASFYVTGTGTITTINGARTGRRIVLQFVNGAVLGGGGNLTLPTSTVTIGAGHTMEFEGDGANWKLVTIDQIAGTFTPVLTFATPGDLAITYSIQVGSYVRTGKLCTVAFTISCSAFTHTTASGAAEITGLPFTSVTASGYLAFGAMQWTGITKAGYTDIVARIGSNAASISLQASGSGVGVSPVSTGDMPTGGAPTLAGTITYEIA